VVSGAVRSLYGSLGVKGLISCVISFDSEQTQVISSHCYEQHLEVAAAACNCHTVLYSCRLVISVSDICCFYYHSYV